MQWTDLLFAHWPVSVSQLADLVPRGYSIDTFDGTAWLGVVPFRMERVRLRGFPATPGGDVFPEANVRTYVRDEKTGHHGVYFFSLDASNPFAVIGARLWFHLPYYFASMNITGDAAMCRYQSRRLFTRKLAELRVNYNSTGDRLPQSKPGSIEYFLTERYALFTHSRRQLIRGDIHHLPWPLEHCQAEFATETLAAAANIVVPGVKPLLHYARKQDVLGWPPRAIS